MQLIINPCENLKFTWRRLMIRGFTPASISLANSSSVLHADLSSDPSHKDIVIIYKRDYSEDHFTFIN